MIRTRIAGLALASVFLLAPQAHASTRFAIHVGVPVVAPAPVVVVATRPVPSGYVWRPAYYVWTGYGYQLVPAAWVRPPYAGAVWAPGRWAARPHGSLWINGYWRR